MPSPGLHRDTTSRLWILSASYSTLPLHSSRRTRTRFHLSPLSTFTRGTEHEPHSPACLPFNVRYSTLLTRSQWQTVFRPASGSVRSFHASSLEFYTSYSELTVNDSSSLTFKLAQPKSEPNSVFDTIVTAYRFLNLALNLYFSESLVIFV